MSDSNEIRNEFYIPPNYTDSGKVLNGSFNLRNVIEAAAIALLIGYPEFQLIHTQITMKIIIMAVSILPLAIIALVGIDGESLSQYAGHILFFFKNRRKLHFKRVGVKRGENNKNVGKPKKSSNKQQARKKI